jgi:hypothetical protein
MLKLHRLNAPENINDEYNNIENVVAYIITEDPTGHEVVVGYVYKENNKLRRELAGWL